MIKVVQYDQKWKSDFQEIKTFLNTELSDQFRIVHVGSTSVEGLSAKPVIDIDILCNTNQMKELIKSLSKLGYTHRGDLGIEGREAFAPNEEIKEKFQKHHLYAGDEFCPAIQNHLLLKKFLEENHEYVIKYSNLKIHNAALYGDNIDKYIEAKSDLIHEDAH